MFHTRNPSQNTAEFVLLDQLVEEDYLTVISLVSSHIGVTILPEACFQNGNFIMTVNKTDTFVQITKHLHTQQLTEKATGQTKSLVYFRKKPPVEKMAETAQKVLKTSEPGDGKIFI